MWPTADAITAITRPCASATPTRSAPVMIAPPPTNMSAKAPTNSAVPRLRKSPSTRDATLPGKSDEPGRARRPARPRASRAPVRPREEHDHGDELEPPEPHERDHDALGDVAEGLERADRPREAEGRADVAQRRGRRRGCLERAHRNACPCRLDGQQERADGEDAHVEEHEADHGAQGALVRDPLVQADRRDDLRVQRLIELATQDLADEQVARYLERPRSRACRAAGEQERGT